MAYFAVVIFMGFALGTLVRPGHFSPSADTRRLRLHRLRTGLIAHRQMVVAWHVARMQSIGSADTRVCAAFDVRQVQVERHLTDEQYDDSGPQPSVRMSSARPTSAHFLDAYKIVCLYR